MFIFYHISKNTQLRRVFNHLAIKFKSLICLSLKLCLKTVIYILEFGHSKELNFKFIWLFAALYVVHNKLD